MHEFVGKAAKSERKVHGLGFLLRLATTIIERQLNCDEIWKQYRDKAGGASFSDPLGDNSRYFRLNAQFVDESFSFDDVKSLEKLEKLTEKAIREGMQDEIQTVVEKLIASCFYFERIGLVGRNADTERYECSGKIFCLLSFSFSHFLPPLDMNMHLPLALSGITIISSTRL